jgi:hypothetical protein
MCRLWWQRFARWRYAVGGVWPFLRPGGEGAEFAQVVGLGLVQDDGRPGRDRREGVSVQLNLIVSVICRRVAAASAAFSAYKVMMAVLAGPRT